ncbi:unnamed protein product [Rhizoctonia solani]|uniref:G domain-containing protein n=1 Tax=Rhizoctonia solani TaxID=456999 RepID=A0A8H2ZXV8_9AGAM|nr:unnamed protein product [Rhizoctonia solani]
MFTARPNGPPYSGPSRYRTDSWVNRPPPVYMLVMGPQGCGKSKFVNMAIGRFDCPTSNNFNLCTQSFHFSKFSKHVNQCEFRFTDTPGFGNDMIDDRRILQLLVENFSPIPYGDRGLNSSIPQFRKVAGLLYIHSEDEPFKSRTSRETIEMLAKVLGTQFLNRVTVLIASQNNTQINISAFMPSEDSPIYPLYSNAIKPRTVVWDQNPQLVEHILYPYTGLYPRNIFLTAIDKFAREYGSNWQQSDIPRYLTEFFHERKTPLETVGQANLLPNLQEQHDELKRLYAVLARKDEEIKFIQSAQHKELEDIRGEKLRESFNHEVELKRLHNVTQDQEAELSKLKQSKDSDAKRLEILKNEIEKRSSNKNSEIERLQEQLKAKDERLIQLEILKNEEISKLSSEKDSEIKGLQGLRARNDELEGLQAESERKIQELQDMVRAKESEIRELSSRVNGTPTKVEGNSGGEVYRLNAELRRVKAEYASLRNHTQLQENTEQAHITTAVNDINRFIEELAQSLVEHVEDHLGRSSPKTIIRPQDLLEVFGPAGNGLASKAEQDTSLLLEYVIQTTVCGQLYAHLFKPFHPSISEDEKCNTFIMEIYDQMVLQGK